jgi:hypothetical protein
MDDDPLGLWWREIARKAARLRTIDNAVLGCRFLYSPPWTLLQNTGLLVVGINPGREADMRDRPYPDRDANAYLWEDWGVSRYRYAMLGLMRAIYRHYGAADSDTAINATLTSNFIPFRSARFSEITKDVRADMISFSIDMWRTLLPQTGVRAVLCAGQVAWDGMYRVCRDIGLPSPVSVPHASHSSFGMWCADYAIKQLDGIGFMPSALERGSI